MTVGIFKFKGLFLDNISQEFDVVLEISATCSAGHSLVDSKLQSDWSPRNREYRGLVTWSELELYKKKSLCDG